MINHQIWGWPIFREPYISIYIYNELCIDDYQQLPASSTDKLFISPLFVDYTKSAKLRPPFTKVGDLRYSRLYLAAHSRKQCCGQHNGQHSCALQTARQAWRKRGWPHSLNLEDPLQKYNCQFHAKRPPCHVCCHLPTVERSFRKWRMDIPSGNLT